LRSKLERMAHPLDNLTHLFFPRYCAGCEVALHFHEQSICVHCLIRLPRLKMHEEREHKLEKLFWGRCEVSQVTAFLRMSRKGLTHRLIHELKYDHNPHLGIVLGRLFGAELRNSPSWKNIDALIPVPLHPRKERERGYNQSYQIALGMAEAMRIPVYRHALKRNEYTQTQTKKSRIDRWKNVDEIFTFNKELLENHNNILIIDDVITTGATIEACVNTILKESKARIHIAALAMPIR
jgi:ComF family protein